MRQVLNLCVLTALAVSAPFAAATAQQAPMQMAQAPAGPPATGWSPPGAPQNAPVPPSSGWQAPDNTAAAPAGLPPGGWSAPSQRDCGAEFMPLRADAEKKAAAIKNAAATKQQQAVCQAFKTFAAAEAKVVKFVEEKGAECRIPPDALKAMKSNHAKTLEIRTKVCDVAAAPARRAPSLSDALGTSRLPSVNEPGTPAKRSTTFDTLTGNPLSR